MTRPVKELLPRNSLQDFSRSWIAQSCPHINVGVCSHIVSTSGRLMYFRCCYDCGEHNDISHPRLKPTKGELRAQYVAVHYKLEEIPSKQQMEALRYQRRQEPMFLYYQYLDSSDWHQKRQQVIERDKVCQLCSGPIECVHHLTYERLFDEHLDDLVGLCGLCHDHVHGIARAEA